MRIRYQIGLGALGLVAVGMLLRSLATIVLSGQSTKICPHCGSCYINPSRTPALRDRIFRLVGCLAYRCKVCNYRFYRPRFSPS
jgi:hypothetical protein